MGGLRKQQALLVDRQQHVEAAAAQKFEREGQIGLGMGGDRRAAMNARHKSRKPADAVRIRIQHLDAVSRETQRRDGLAGRRRGAFGEENAQGSRVLGHKGKLVQDRGKVTPGVGPRGVDGEERRRYSARLWICNAPILWT